MDYHTVEKGNRKGHCGFSLICEGGPFLEGGSSAPQNSGGARSKVGRIDLGGDRATGGVGGEGNKAWSKCYRRAWASRGDARVQAEKKGEGKLQRGS